MLKVVVFAMSSTMVTGGSEKDRIMHYKKLLPLLALLLLSAPVLAQEETFEFEPTGIAANTMETWQGNLPILIVIILIVVVVDVVFIMMMRRNSDQS